MSEEQKKSQVALAEEKILQFWQDNNIFQKSVDKEAPQGEFVFFDGPPYATGLPHYGHLLPGTMKDVIPRYKTMRGFRVPRQWGWDCHGLPIENLIQKELNLPTKQDIVEYGIEKFNKAARDSVLRYEKDWKEYIPRVGRFVDMDNPYMTMDSNYMESVWAVFKNLKEKGLVYKGYKSMMVSPPLETVLSNQEVNMGGYKDITDLSVTAKFKLSSGEHAGSYMLAWTTTPWTLPGNVLLAVGEDIEYVKINIDLGNGALESGIVKKGEKVQQTLLKSGQYIIAKKLVSKILGSSEYTILESFKGSDLVGSTYEPVFPLFKDHANAFRVVVGDFVTTEDGTGIVHIAPGFGEDDLNLGQKENVEPIQHVNMNGRFTKEVEDFLVEGGYDVKDWAVRNTEDHMHVDVEIVKYLAHNGLLFSKKKYIHSYPMCWRTDCPLINYATESWFVNVQKIKKKLIKNNQKTSWVPEHVKDGRFGNWLEEVRDWSVSRARFWGTPLPIWQSEDGENLFIGSVEELWKYSNEAITKIIFVRHGEAEHNVLNMSSSAIDKHPLTALGNKQAQEAARKLSKEDVDVVYVSPVLRARQTVGYYTKISGKEATVDNRLQEITSGDWEETSQNDPHVKEERDAYKKLSNQERYVFKRGGKGESWEDLDKRTRSFLDEVIQKHPGKTIAVFSHQGTGSSLVKHVKGFSNEEAVEQIYAKKKYTAHATPVKMYLDTKRNIELDLHRPYIDEIQIEKDGKKFTRIEDVFDVWFDSGSMPYASHHYPFDTSRFQPKSGLFKKTKRFPADFVAEGQDQTRGWFYVMMVLASAQFDQPAFKNVLVNGLVLAEDGKKMSKRLKNYPDVSHIVNKEGADALRLFLMASPAVHAEDVNFSEKSVGETQSKVMGRLRNTTTFYEMYQSGETAHDESENVLDQWILARLSETHAEVTRGLEGYILDKAARPLFDFVDDLSTWYIRRSRDRFKSEGRDKVDGLSTTRFVLREFAKIAAPFIPFVAEEVFQMVREENDSESVHLCEWSDLSLKDSSIILSMEKTRELASVGLELRQKSGIKVRQPLASFTSVENLSEELQEIVRDELNVKEILFGKENKIDETITPELKQEGQYRELLRAVQSLRKKNNLDQNQFVTLKIDGEEVKEILKIFEEDLKRSAQIKTIVYGSVEGEEIDLEDFVVKISI